MIVCCGSGGTIGQSSSRALNRNRDPMQSNAPPKEAKKSRWMADENNLDDSAKSFPLRPEASEWKPLSATQSATAAATHLGPQLVAAPVPTPSYVEARPALSPGNCNDAPPTSNTGTSLRPGGHMLWLGRADDGEEEGDGFVISFGDGEGDAEAISEAAAISHLRGGAHASSSSSSSPSPPPAVMTPAAASRSSTLKSLSPTARPFTFTSEAQGKLSGKKATSPPAIATALKVTASPEANSSSGSNRISASNKNKPAWAAGGNKPGASATPSSFRPNASQWKPPPMPLA